MYIKFLIQGLLASAVSAVAIPHGWQEQCFPTSRQVQNVQSNVAGCGTATLVNYVIQAGDTLTSIAAAFNSGICNIATLNGIQDPNAIDVGSTIIIPQNCSTPNNTSCLPQTRSANNTCVLGPPPTYTVRSGDTLSTIATNFLLTLDALVAANPQIEDINMIYVDQVINIPVCPGSTCQQATYVIQSGDTFFNLANSYNTTVGQILEANPGVDPTTLQVGQVINLPQQCTA